MINITHTPNAVHIDGLAISPDEAFEIAAQLMIHAHAAEGEARIHKAFREYEGAHAREKFAHDSERDQRETGERLEH